MTVHVGWLLYRLFIFRNVPLQNVFKFVVIVRWSAVFQMMYWGKLFLPYIQVNRIYDIWKCWKDNSWESLIFSRQEYYESCVWYANKYGVRVFFSLCHIVIFYFILVYTFFVLSVNTFPNIFKPGFVTVPCVAFHLSFLDNRPDS